MAETPIPSDPKILDALNLGVIILDSTRRVLGWNAWLAEKSGIPAETARGRSLARIFPASVESALGPAVDKALDHGLSSVFSHHLHPHLFPLSERRGGATHTLALSTLVRPIAGTGEGEGERFCLIQITDISATVTREEHLRGMATYARTLFEASLDALITTSTDGLVNDLNQAAERITGLARAELIGRDLAGCFAEAKLVHQVLEKALAKGAVSDVALSFRRPDGSITEVLCNATVFNGQGERAGGVLLAARDMTERRRVERELEFLATTDALTQVANRRHFFVLAEHEVSRARRYGRVLSVIIFDLDNFKGINDQHGHAAGDTVLQWVTTVSREALRTVDILGRIGGEEFAVLLPETDLEGARVISERLRQAIADIRIDTASGVLAITTSLGVAAIGDADNFHNLLIRADKALYEAKRLGRNRTVAADGA